MKNCCTKGKGKLCIWTLLKELPSGLCETCVRQRDSGQPFTNNLVSDFGDSYCFSRKVNIFIKLCFCFKETTPPPPCQFLWNSACLSLHLALSREPRHFIWLLNEWMNAWWFAMPLFQFTFERASLGFFPRMQPSRDCLGKDLTPVVDGSSPRLRQVLA